MSKRAATASGCLVLALLLTGCTAPTDLVSDAVDQGIAATATARLALDQHHDGRTLTTTANTTLLDARRELVDASGTVADAGADSASDANARDDALDALDTAIDAVNAATDALAGIGDASEASARVSDAEAGLRALADQLKAAS